MTRQRACVLDVLRSDMCHHTAEEIFALCRLRLPTISRATVYNNLKALESERLIRRITGDDGRDRYDNAYIPHAHTVCERCGRVRDLDLDGLDESLRHALGHDFNSYELKVRIVCGTCLANDN